GSTPRSPGGPARKTSPLCSPPGPADGCSPPTCGAPCAASPPGPACPPTWPATSDPARYSTHSPRCTFRPADRSATCMAPWDTPTRAPPGGTTRPGIPRPPARPGPRPGSTGRLSPGLHTEPRTRDRGPGADPTATPGSLSMPAALITRPTAKRRDLARWALQPLKRTQHAEGAGPILPHGFGGYQEWGRSGRTPP